jgi:CBS domain-containing protein
MGDQRVSEQANDEQHRAFMRALLDDVAALERLIDEDRIESGVRRLGAEQEMFLVDRALRPAPLAREVTVASIMRADPVTVTPETEALEAMRILREERVGCLPVVAGERLVGIVPERDLLEVAARLLESALRGA